MSVVEQLKQNIINHLVQAAAAAKEAKELNFEELPEFVLEVPRERQFGDYAANLAMVLARAAKLPPRQIAEILIKNFDLQGTWVSRMEIAGPGFINFYLDHHWLYEVIPEVKSKDQRYGWVNIGAGRKVQVEFVSANPTGLLHMGNARGAALGDSLASVLAAAGYEVSREFYINDAGNQIENFGKSLEARYLELLGHEVVFPEDGYHGQDVADTVQGFIKQYGNKYANVDSALRREILVQYALREKLDNIKAVLKSFGVEYDVWFSEQTLHDSGEIQRTLDELRLKEYIYEKEGALWFKSTQFGDEKDEVVVRKNGIPTYFAADIAYHKNKFARGFDWVINIWGADHHGHVARMKGAMEALGYDPRRLDVVLMQLVRLLQGGEIVRMSKRTGQYITLSDLIEEVGRDAARYFFAMRSADSHLEFDLDLAKSESADNPVYYVQYAHARICSILRQAAEAGFTVPPVDQTRPDVLSEPAELELLRHIANLPAEVITSATGLEPHRIARYVHDLAGVFHSFYNSCRVLTDDAARRSARLLLVDATRITLRNGLHLLGITAPERM